MENIVVFGFGYEGWLCYLEISKYKGWNMLGFADNAANKQGNMAFGYPIKSMEQVEILHKIEGISVIIASRAWAERGRKVWREWCGRRRPFMVSDL